MKRKISAKILVLAGALFAADGSRHNNIIYNGLQYEQ